MTKTGKTLFCAAMTLFASTAGAFAQGKIACFAAADHILEASDQATVLRDGKLMRARR